MLCWVGEGGVEPPRPFGHTDLNRARLPFRHSPECDQQASTRACCARSDGAPGYDLRRQGRGTGVGVLQRFERRLEGLVEGAFARVFGGVVQPVEVAGALQREAADKKQIVGHGRVLVPNAFVVELSATDLERFGEWDAALRSELAGMVEEHARDQGWSFVGDVEVQFEQSHELDTGVFRVRSSVVASDAPAHRTEGIGRPRVVVQTTPERVVLLTRPVTVVGRGADADLQLADTGVSRAHAELRLEGGTVRVADLSSTNGTMLNGRRVRIATLSDGDRLDLGATTLVYRSEA